MPNSKFDTSMRWATLAPWKLCRSSSPSARERPPIRRHVHVFGGIFFRPYIHIRAPSDIDMCLGRDCKKACARRTRKQLTFLSSRFKTKNTFFSRHGHIEIQRNQRGYYHEKIVRYCSIRRMCGQHTRRFSNERQQKHAKFTLHLLTVVG